MELPVRISLSRERTDTCSPPERVAFDESVTSGSNSLKVAFTSAGKGTTWGTALGETEGEAVAELLGDGEGDGEGEE